LSKKTIPYILEQKVCLFHSETKEFFDFQFSKFLNCFVDPTGSHLLVSTDKGNFYLNLISTFQAHKFTKLDLNKRILNVAWDKFHGDCENSSFILLLLEDQFLYTMRLELVKLKINYIFYPLIQFKNEIISGIEMEYENSNFPQNCFVTISTNERFLISF
jgi:hypothetical protein